MGKAALGRTRTRVEERTMKYVVFALLLLVAPAGHAAGWQPDQDTDAQISAFRIAMDNDGHMQCLMRGVSDYYNKHVSTVNILQRCGITDEKKSLPRSVPL
jgi:hypothetical protein